MKKRLFLFSCFALVLAFLFLNALTAVTEENSAKETELPPIIADLLSGKNADPQLVLSNLEAVDIPLALTACEVLHHKALHQDIKIAPQAVETFKTELQKRMESSQTVSFKQTSTCIQKIPAREIVIEGKHLTIPQHFLAPVKFAISGFSPDGEAGTLFPEIKVAFSGGKSPINSKIILDGKEIPVKLKGNSFLYSSPFQRESILKFGKHRVEATLIDASKDVASISWEFTVGEKIIAVSGIPTDAVLVGSFTAPLSVLQPDATGKNVLVVNVFESVDGTRTFEYCLFNPADLSRPIFKTTSVGLLRKIVARKRVDDLLTINPKTEYAFSGNELLFSLNFIGNGSITEVCWEFTNDLNETSTAGEYSVSKTLGKWLISHCKITVEEESSNGGSVSSHYYASKSISAIDPAVMFWPAREIAFTEQGSGTIPIFGVCGVDTGLLTEGVPVDYYGGKLTPILARLKVVSGGATIESPTASQTKLIFAVPGVAEVILDLFLTYDFGKEHYKWVRPPAESGLYGLFKVKGQTEFSKMPEGIISGTSRKISLKKVSVTIDGSTRTFSKPEDLVIAPPWKLAESSLLPESDPLALSKLTLGMTVKRDEDLSSLAFENSFTTLLAYQSNREKAEEILCRLYAYPTTYKNKKKPDKPSSESPGSLSDWLSVKGFPNPANLIDVQITPRQVTVPPGQKQEFKAVIVPKPRLGTGQITPESSNLVLLGGYTAEQVTDLEWETASSRGVSWVFPWEPPPGTGSYDIKASAKIEVKEADTSTLATAEGMGSGTALIVPGFQILSPVRDFAYPQGAEIRVETTIASDSEWQNIKWFLNGDPWSPNKNPAGKLVIEQPGSYVLKAVYNKDRGEEVSEVAFLVKPITFSLLPTRSVFAFVKDEKKVIESRVSLNNHDVTKPGIDVDWEGTTQKAQVEKIEWQGFFKESTCGTLKPENDSLRAIAEFTSEGALTALATITVRISKSGKPGQKRHSESFVLPGSRGDLWGVKTPASYELKGHFPQLALAKAGRTFVATEARFDVFNRPYIWTPEGLSPKVVLTPALSGIPDLESQAFDFLWKSSNDATSKNNSFVVSFMDVGNKTISLETGINFGDPGTLPIIEGNFPLEVASIAKFISPQITPASFSIPIGKTQLLRYEIQPSRGKESEVAICQNTFKVQVQDVEWSKENEKIGVGNPFKFVSQKKESGIVVGKGDLFFQETFEPPANGGFAGLSGETKFSVENPITKIVIRRLTPSVSDNEYQEVGFRKEENRFRAIAYSGNDELGAIPVQWKLEDGFATTTLQLEILKAQGVSTGQIAMINLDENSPPAEEVKLTSFLPGKISLSAEGKGLKTLTQIRVKQPTLWLSIKAVEGVGSLTQLPTWISETQSIWLQGNNFLNVKIRHGGEEDENFPWIENASFTDADPFSCEPLFKKETNGLWLSLPIARDPLFDGQNSNGNVMIPRLSQRVLREKRSSSLDRGKKSDLNAYVVKQTYFAVTNYSFPGGYEFKKAAGYSLSQDECYEFGGMKKINDFASSGIFLSNDAKVLFQSRYPRDFAHEIGHHLIQIGLYPTSITGLASPTIDEHVDDSDNLMRGGGLNQGQHLTASQAFMILDFERIKPETSYFIVEE